MFFRDKIALLELQADNQRQNAEFWRDKYSEVLEENIQLISEYSDYDERMLALETDLPYLREQAESQDEIIDIMETDNELLQADLAEARTDNGQLEHELSLAEIKIELLESLLKQLRINVKLSAKK